MPFIRLFWIVVNISFFKMEVNILLTFFMSLCAKLAEPTYRISRQSGSWEDAEEHCKHFNGHLATLGDMGKFRAWLKTQQTTFLQEETMELWVGASLEVGEWHWDGRREAFNGTVRFYDIEGCHRQQYWSSGIQIPELTPQLCLDQCGWRGRVGLKKDYCLCEGDLQNVTSAGDAICHIACDGDAKSMCGGYFGVSVYKPDNMTIGWAKDESSEENNCAVLRKLSMDSDQELSSANCDMRTRSLCSYSDDVTCGLHESCIRSSSEQNTWSAARTGCNMTSLFDGDVRRSDVRDLKNLAPGSYWIALSRAASWVWTLGSTVRMADFFPHETGRIGSSGRSCAVLRLVHGSSGLAARDCEANRHFLCQYDYMEKRDGPTPPGPSENDGLLQNVTGSDVFNTQSTSGVTGLGIPTENNENSKSNEFDFLGITGTASTCVHLVLGSKDDSLHISPPPSDVTYDTVYDHAESPFRRTQRLIRMGSANAWRQTHQTPTRRVGRSDASDSSGSDYTWRGMIGGKIEIVNTELRNQYPEHSIAATCARAERMTPDSTLRTRLDVHEPILCSDGIYDMPERPVSSANNTHKHGNSGKIVEGTTGPTMQENLTYRRESDASRGDNDARSQRDSQDPTFLQFQLSRNSMNEENIYATIKKTFEKIKDDLAEQARREEPEEEEQMMYSVRLSNV
ncbi:hypothetical protein MAR_020510 [Mya arenaria]|uniref:C-type lectin domain-containing protein n=1 Tax=Mya arenaria TaxID=6604 RepID=A0ABY7EDB3_MYAAR|nr:hypothetical protein MAR_020510 [Mya arenaria]